MQPMLATRKSVRVLAQRVRLLASIVLLALLLLLSALVLSSRPHVNATATGTGISRTAGQSSTGPDLRDEHPQRQYQEWVQAHQQTVSPSSGVPIATNGRGHVPAAGAGSCQQPTAATGRLA